MNQRIRFNYASRFGGSDSLMPRLNFQLHLRQQEIDIVGIVDSGSTVNVLPYQLGVAIGAVWQEQKPIAPLAGNLGSFEARALLLQASHPQLTGTNRIEMVFAWSKSEDVPVLFGQMNFFLAFDVCFFRSENAFEIQRR